MKKVIMSILMIGVLLGMTGCIVRDDTTKYKRETRKISEEIVGLEIEDISSDIQILSEDIEDVLIEYTDSVDEQLYTIEVDNKILKVAKKKTTVNNEESNVIIKLPSKIYSLISVITTNGDVELNKIKSTVYRCSTENGDIRGILDGKKKEYSIAVETENGESNLKDSLISSENKLEMKTQNGDIDIRFTEE